MFVKTSLGEGRWKGLTLKKLNYTGELSILFKNMKLKNIKN